MLKGRIKNNFKKMYTTNYVLLFVSSLAYLGYFYYSRIFLKQNNDAKLATPINTDPNFVIIIMIVSVNTLVGWYFWTHKQLLLDNFKSMVTIMLTQLIFQLILNNLVVLVSSLLTLLGSYFNKNNFKNKKPISISYFSFLIFTIFIYVFIFYLLYQIDISKNNQFVF